LDVISQTIFPANLLTGAKHPKLNAITTENNIKKTQTNMHENYQHMHRLNQTKGRFRGVTAKHERGRGGQTWPVICCNTN